ncbi:hypothetical protein EYC84_010935 [Monilinia fructicola]|uniref:Uncharacterized protein n=1 Tax=Monilinia fructicola TaxID=38448 RepID=A0A5M9J6N6_MONFR|nr:hypothetical protein EYC84_010935 [Monilinia fructicola]
MHGYIRNARIFLKPLDSSNSIIAHYTESAATIQTFVSTHNPRLQLHKQTIQHYTNIHTMPALNPTQKSPERAFALQKYLLLHSQHDALQKHLTQVTASIPDSPTDRHRNSSVSSDSSNGSDAPLETLPSTFDHTQHLPREHRINSLPAVIDETVVEEIEEDEQKLKNVNQQIKTTLTDLLNCESVRADLRYRKWVQTRLMDTERELKENRSKSCERRRSEDMSL